MTSRVLIALALAAAAPAPACNKGTSTPPAAGSGSAAAESIPEQPIRPKLPPTATTPYAVDEGDDAGSGAGPGSDGARARWRERIAQFDTNGDGVISPDERAAMSGARATAIFQRFDADADGKLTQPEVQGTAIERRIGDFAQADTDRDGSLSQVELAAALDAGALRRSGADHWRRGSGGFVPATPGTR
jgi:hypothetical protein